MVTRHFASSLDAAGGRSLANQEDDARMTQDERDQDAERAEDYRRFGLLVARESGLHRPYAPLDTNLARYVFGKTAAYLATCCWCPEFDKGVMLADAARELASRYGWASVFRVLAREMEEAEGQR